jgi:hypothetical protein
MYYGTPPIVTNGMVLNLDPQSPQSIPLDPTVNLYNSSENISVFPWTSTNGTRVTSSAVAAPYGTGPTNLFTTTAAFSSIFQERTLYQGTYNISWHIKYVNQQYYNIVYEGNYGVARFDIINGVVNTFYNGPNLTRISAASITPAPNGYYRINATLNVTESVINFARINLWPGAWSSNNYSGSQAYIWGAQLSRTSYVTPYVSSSATVLGSITSWQDISGNNNTATLFSSSISGSIPVFPAANDRVLQFDGTGSYARIPYNITLDPTSSITFEAWVYPTDLTTIRYQELYRKEILPGRHLFSFQEYGTILSFGTWTSTYDELDIIITPSTYVNRWNHFVATYTSGYKAIYANGTLIGSSTVITGSLIQGNTIAYIGSSQGVGEFFKGKYGLFKMYNRALPQAEITQNYNALKSRFGLQ